MKVTEIDPETLVIGALCKSPEARKQFLDKIARDDFNIRTYGTIYEALVTLTQSGHHITMETVTSFFTETIDRMQVSFLFDTKIESVITPETYAAFKASGTRTRQVRLRDYIDKAIKQGLPSATISEQIRIMTTNLEGHDTELEVATPDEAVDSTEWLLDQWAKGDRPVISGLPELDEKLFLSQFLGYWVIAGNSSVGKTAMMCRIIKENARRGVPGTVCSLEMRKELLLIRMAMEDPRVRGLELTERNIKDAKKMSDLKYAMNTFRRMPVSYIEGVRDIYRLDKICRSIAQDGGSRWLTFDYIQLGNTKPTDSDVVRVYNVSRKLQGLTVPDLANGYHGQVVIAFSQYSNEATKSRNDEVVNEQDGRGATRQKRKPSKPGNSDLAWSGQIKQDADGILHIHPVSDTEGDVVDTELHCGKQRNYKSGWTVLSRFIKAEQTFITPMSEKQANAPGSIQMPVENRKVTF